MEILFSNLPLKEVLGAIDFDRIKSDIREYPPDRAATRDINFGHDVSYTPRLFALKNGTAIVPHGHHNMVSMHLVLEGEFHLKHYDRTDDGPSHTILWPTIDRVSRAGDFSSISDHRDNVHWFRTLTDRAFTFDVIVAGITPGTDGRGLIDYVDPLGGEVMADGRIRARRIGSEEAFRTYGNAAGR
jgi:hypothetical protein